jgi:hypothetical protein
MDQLSPRARRIVEAYKDTISPAGRTELRNWEEIVRRINAEEGSLDRRTLWSRGRLLAGLALLVGAAALVLTVGGDGIRLHSENQTAASQALAYGVDGILGQGEAVHLGGARTPRSPAASSTPDDASGLQRTDLRGPGDPRIGSSMPLEPKPWTDTREAPAPHPEAEKPALPPARTQRSRPATARPVRPNPRAEDDAQVQALRAEIQLIGQARAALRDDRPREALRLLARHARTFPQGEMQEERMVLRAAALCEAGQVEASRRSVAMFLRTHPRSPLAANVRRICRAVDPVPSSTTPTPPPRPGV